MNTEKDFIETQNFEATGNSKWEAPSNIALIKYWG